MQIQVPDVGTVSGLLERPEGAQRLLVLAHGAGTDMRHRSMEATSRALHDVGIATLRYNFLYKERGGSRTDPPAVAHAIVRASVAMATELAPDLPLYAGGRSFGGRMTSQAAALDPLPSVRGLVFYGFPLHPAGKPGIERARHLDAVVASGVPMLFLQGDHDALAELPLLHPVVERLGKLATLHVVESADHSFHVPKRSGRTDEEVLQMLAQTIAAWCS